MTTEEFLVNYNGAPYSQEEIAEVCVKISDSDEFQQAAKKLLSAIETFDYQLDKIDFEYG